MNIIKAWLVLVPLFAVSGCLSITSYVDPSYAKGTVNDLQAVENEYFTTVTLQYFSGGEEHEDFAVKLRDYVERNLLLTGVLVAQEQDAEHTLKIIVNNNGESDGAITAGLTFGLVAAVAVENLEIVISLVDKLGVENTRQYEHKIHSTVGISGNPPIENAAPTSWDDALDTVIWQIVVNFLIDMQQDGLLTVVEPNAFDVLISRRT